MDYTPIQLVIPLELTKIIDISDPVYSFNEVMNHMDLNKFEACTVRIYGRGIQFSSSYRKIMS